MIAHLFIHNYCFYEILCDGELSEALLALIERHVRRGKVLPFHLLHAWRVSVKQVVLVAVIMLGHITARLTVCTPLYIILQLGMPACDGRGRAAPGELVDDGSSLTLSPTGGSGPRAAGGECPQYEYPKRKC